MYMIAENFCDFFFIFNILKFIINVEILRNAT